MAVTFFFKQHSQTRDPDKLQTFDGIWWSLFWRQQQQQQQAESTEKKSCASETNVNVQRKLILTTEGASDDNHDINQIMAEKKPNDNNRMAKGRDQGKSTGWFTDVFPIFKRSPEISQQRNTINENDCGKRNASNKNIKGKGLKKPTRPLKDGRDLKDSNLLRTNGGEKVESEKEKQGESPQKDNHQEHQSPTVKIQENVDTDKSQTRTDRKPSSEVNENELDSLGTNGIEEKSGRENREQKEPPKNDNDDEHCSIDIKRENSDTNNPADIQCPSKVRENELNSLGTKGKDEIAKEKQQQKEPPKKENNEEHQSTKQIQNLDRQDQIDRQSALRVSDNEEDITQQKKTKILTPECKKQPENSKRTSCYGENSKINKHPKPVQESKTSREQHLSDKKSNQESQKQIEKEEEALRVERKKELELLREQCKEEIGKLDENLVEQRKRMEELKATVRNGNLQEQTLRLVQMQGQAAAASVQNTMRETYDRGMQDAMTYLKVKMKKAQETEINGLVVMYEKNESSRGIASIIGDMFRTTGFLVPPAVSLESELPPPPQQYRFRWLVMYIVIMEDSFLDSLIQKVREYLSHSIFCDSLKLLIVQILQQGPCNSQESLKCTKTTFIVATDSKYHRQIEKELKGGDKSFENLVDRLISNAESRTDCFVSADTSPST